MVHFIFLSEIPRIGRLFPMAAVETYIDTGAGDVVFVMEKCDDGWYVGTSQRTGIFGTFPGNYVTKV